MRIVFFGTPEFGKTILRGLLDAGYDVPLVVTQPARSTQRRGRSTAPAPSVVAAYAAEQGLTVESPDRIATLAQPLRDSAADAFVVAAYGRIIPEALLRLRPPWVNVHASLLPAYRGASPVTQAILDGRKTTGVSLMAVAKELDAGGVYTQKQIRIADGDTTGTLTGKLARLGAALLVERLPAIVSGKLKPTPQDDAQATYTKKLTRSLGRVDWSRDAAYLERFVRAMQPWPTAWTELEGNPVTILAARSRAEGTDKPGTFKAGAPLAVAAGSGSLVIERIRPAGKQAMSGADWLRGRRTGGRFN